jgi:predicted O-methyltransferase YrrM
MLIYVGRVCHSIAKRIYGRSYSLSDVDNQNSKFLSMGLNRELALEKINEICIRKFGREYDEQNGMWSEHLILMTALSLSKNDVRSILEIGTFIGETTALLEELFPDARIETVDLAQHEIVEQGIFRYAANSIEQGRHIYKSDRINFRVMNSLRLIDESDKFDLIWVDGNHVSPFSIVDISNSIRLLSPDGIAFCDDVYIKANKLDKFSDTSSFDTLCAFEKAGIIKFTLVKKRVSKRFNNRLVKSKHLGVYSLT